MSRDSGVTIAPFSPAPAAYTTGELDVEMEIQAEPEHTPAEAPFIPPVAETPPSRMPRVEDFPPVVQRQIEARQSPQEEDRGPLSLLRRLASVGLGRREEDPIGAGRHRPAAAAAAIVAAPAAAGSDSATAAQRLRQAATGTSRPDARFTL